MAIEGFDYKGFATSMAEQAQELVPKELEDREKEYVVKTLGNFTLLAGEALYNDESLKLTAEQAVFITQIIAEWSFHKSIDLIHSGILPQYWDSIMQKIAFTIFEVAKQAILRNIPQDQLLQAVEHHVIKVYKQSIEELEQKGLINEEIKNRAESQSNIDAMAQQAQAEQQKQQQAEAEEASRQQSENQKKREEKRRHREAARNSVNGISNKQMKLMSLALVLKILSQDKVTTILNKFDSNDSLQISQYMNMADLESKLDGDLVANCLREIKDYLPHKKKLSKENILGDLLRIYRSTPRDKIEKVIKNERPLVKRFISQAYDGEFSEIPLRVAGIVAQYVEDSI
ncbi:hypothetical protein IKQ21_02045 [bacterium]|nr:hypothetical protein [bacterium]